MIRILLNGCMGRMGRAVTALVDETEDMQIVAGVDRTNGIASYPVYDSLDSVDVTADILVDFSHSSALDSVLQYALAHRLPVVLATTGYKNDQVAGIRRAADYIPIFFTFNMSIGINLLLSLCKQAATVLGDFDVEITEKHHNQKLDAPSGTALMLADTIDQAKGHALQREYDRHARRAVRPKNEIGIHSIRGGNIVGEHEVLFAGSYETVTLTHTAYSRDVFARGALKAVSFMTGRSPGLYDMSDVLSI